MYWLWNTKCEHIKWYNSCKCFERNRVILIIKNWRIRTYPIVFVIVMQWGITTSVYQFSKGRLTIYHYTRRLQLVFGFFCISMQYVAKIYSTSRFWVDTINGNILEIHYSYVWIISNVDKKDNRSNTLILHNFNNGLSTESICKITVNLAYELHSRHGQKPTPPNVTFVYVCMCTYHPHFNTKRAKLSVSRVMKKEIHFVKTCCCL